MLDSDQMTLYVGVMNKLDPKARTQILRLLCAGQSILSITRVMGVSKNTVAKLLSDAGAVCAEYQDQAFRDLTCKRVQVDEIWSFTYAKQRSVATAKAVPGGAGDTWTWTAICADTKLVMSWLVGGRDSEYAMAFMDELAQRLADRVQLTSDGRKAYLEAVEGAFGADIDYAMLIKMYGEPAGKASQRRYSPAECTGARKTRIEGNPDLKHVSTSYSQRQNQAMRMHMRRLTRLTNGFSTKVEAHANNVALHFMYYNFVRTHSSLRMSPAMAAGVTDKLWEVSDIVALIEAKEAQRQAKRGPH